MLDAIGSILWASIYFGAPIFGIAYLLFISAFRSGLLHPALSPSESKKYLKALKNEGKADKKQRKRILKERRKELRREIKKTPRRDVKAQASESFQAIKRQLAEIDWELDHLGDEDDLESAPAIKSRTNFVTQKWLTFGGGFYGLPALYTFIVIEFKQIADFISGFTSLQDFIDRIGLQMLIQQMIEALMNFIWSILWPIYWLDYLDNPLDWIIWLTVGFLAYRFAYWAAQRTAFATFNTEDLVRPDNI